MEDLAKETLLKINKIVNELWFQGLMPNEEALYRVITELDKLPDNIFGLEKTGE